MSDRAGVADALLLCGGSGSRLRADGVASEKPLAEVCGRSMLERVHDALAGNRLERVLAVVSPNAPATRERARDLPCDLLETPGEGYVADLDRALEAVDGPALTVAADLPLLSVDHVDRALDAVARLADAAASNGAPPSDGGIPSVTVCVPAALKRAVGVSVDTSFVPGASTDTQVVPADAAPLELAPTGLNVVGVDDSAEAIWVSRDRALTVNVNRASDLAVARSLCAEGHGCD
ncbi:MAG: NTP transferase domain-containing protein [Haloferacaceae archaeon]